MSNRTNSMNLQKGNSKNKKAFAHIGGKLPLFNQTTDESLGYSLQHQLRAPAARYNPFEQIDVSMNSQYFMHPSKET